MADRRDAKITITPGLAGFAREELERYGRRAAGLIALGKPTDRVYIDSKGNFVSDGPAAVIMFTYCPIPQMPKTDILYAFNLQEMRKPFTVYGKIFWNDKEL